MSSWARYGIAIFCMVVAAPCLSVQAEEGAATSRSRVELSAGSWLFTTGDTRWSHDASGLDPRLGNPTSKLTYKDNDTQIVEFGAKVYLTRRWYLQGDGGFSVDFDRGSLTDDDYVAGQYLFSRTSSTITGAGTWYVNGNVGYRAVEFPGSRGHLDVFGGLQYWQTKYEATGVHQEVCNPSGIPGVACTPNLSLPGVLAISNTTHWITPIHVGLNTEYRITRLVSLDFKASMSPVSILYNEDVHHLRADLQQDPSFSMWGVGVSANAGAALKFMLTRNLALTGGYRVMWNRTYAGTWEVHPVGSGSETVPLTEFQTIRHGATVGLTASF